MGVGGGGAVVIRHVSICGHLHGETDQLSVFSRLHSSPLTRTKGACRVAETFLPGAYRRVQILRCSRTGSRMLKCRSGIQECMLVLRGRVRGMRRVPDMSKTP